jgi:hypothetical protein
MRHKHMQRMGVLALLYTTALLPALVWPLPLMVPAHASTVREGAARVTLLAHDNGNNNFVKQPGSSYTLHPQQWRRHGFSKQVMEWVEHGVSLPLSSTPRPAHGKNYAS